MKNICLTSLFVLSLPVFIFAQTTYYVDDSAQGTNDGTSWQNAFTDLQDAINNSEPGDEIWVAEGIYHPTSTSDRAIYFSLQSGVRLFGGFEGTESNVYDRDISGHPVFIDGDIGVPGDSLDNSYNLFYLFRPDSTTLIDGFTFRYGQADKQFGGTGALGTSGSAILINGLNSFAYPTIRNCVFEHNYSKFEGGAVCLMGGNTGDVGAWVENCRFYNNRSFRRGGAWFESVGSSSITHKGFFNCEFVKNYAQTAGGAISLTTSQQDYYLNINKCLFERDSINSVNVSTNDKGKTISIGVPYANICHIYIDNSVFKDIVTNNVVMIAFDQSELNLGIAKVDLKNSVFENKPVVSSQLGMFAFFFSLKPDIPSSVTAVNFIENCKFIIGARSGLGISNCEKLIITNSQFIEREDFLGFSMGATKELFIKNCIYQKYPGMYSNSYTDQYYYGPILSFGAEKIVVENSTIWKNELAFFGDTLNILNSIIHCDSLIAALPYPYNNHPDVINLQSNIFSTAILPSAPELTVLNTQWATDPLLINPESGDLRLQTCSPAINAGDTTLTTTLTDIAGNPRIMFNTVDMGAYEAGALTAQSAVLVTADCAGENQPTGTILAPDLDGCLPLTYLWSDGLPPIPNQSGLNAGTYTVTISDSRGRSLEQTIVVGENPSPQVVAQTTPVICGTTTGGTAMLDGANGAAPFSFDWGNGLIDSMVTGLAYGIYPVTITDANGCTATANIQIARMGNLQVQIIKNDISCHDEADGNITIQPTNGAPPYGWLWQFNGSTEPGIIDLAPGIYAGTMTDNLGCAVNWIVPLENPDTIAANTEVMAATGPANPDGSILLVPSGGTGDFTAVWDNGTNGLFINNLLPGFYTATITDVNGCTQTVTVEVPWTSGTGEVKVGHVRVWPNPVADWLVVEPQSIPTPFRFILTDACGRVVRVVVREKDGTFGVPVGELPGGVYQWEINDGRLRIAGVLLHHGF